MSSLISSDFPPDSESRGWLQWLGGIGRAVLGFSRKFQNARQFTRINQKVLLMDFSYGNLMAIAQTVPQLNTVIAKGAEMFANMEVKHIDAEGNEVKNSPVLKLLNNPNPVDQTLESFMYKHWVNDAIYNNSFIYKNYGREREFRTPNELPSLLWVLPAGEVKINLSGKIYRQIALEDIILDFRLFLDPQPYMPDEIIYITEGITANGISSGNRIEALQIQLSSIMVALKSLNIILGDRGMVGFFTTESKDENGPMPIKSSIKKQIKDTYHRENSVDSDQSHIGIFTQKTEFHPMTFDVAQLQILEQMEDSRNDICAAFGIDRDLLPSVKGATYENKEQALRQTYQNTIQPKADKLMSYLSNHFGLTAKGEKLVADYSWLPCMKDDALASERAFNFKILSLSQMLHDGVISADQYAELAEVEMDGTGEVIQPPPTGKVTGKDPEEEKNDLK